MAEIADAAPAIDADAVDATPAPPAIDVSAPAEAPAAPDALDAGPSRIATVADEEEELAAEAGVLVDAAAGEAPDGAVNGAADGTTAGADGTGAEPASEPTAGDVDMNEAGEAGEEAAAEPAEPEDACETLYLQNLNEKVRLSVMKETLALLFKPYRPVLPVVAHRNLRMRGQAFVSFADTGAALRAKRDVAEFPLYGKAISISFARTRADAVVAKLEDADGVAAHKAERLARKKEMRRSNPLRQKQRAKLKAGAEEPAEPLAKKPRLQVPDEYLPPNSVLFLQNLAEGTTADDLRDVFGQHPGLVEIRTIPAKRDIAFVEYADEGSATAAKDALHNFKIDGETKMKVTYAKK
ncbi:hypothetical protein Q5752_004407 [Cryptotrichosporon argae]